MARRLITAEDVENYAGSGPIEVCEDVLITPAAVDRAAELGIPVAYCRSEGGALDARGAGTPPLCGKLAALLADGAYFLRIPREPGAEYHVRVTERGCELNRLDQGA